MAFDPIAELLNRVQANGSKWPPKFLEAAWRIIRRRRAFLESDRDALRRIAGWEEGDDRRYKVDPLPERMTEAWADHLWGEDPTITAAGAADDGTPPPDQTRLDDLVAANDLPEELRAAEQLCAGEGEVWFRLAIDPDVSDHAIIEWHSRLSVAPLFVGRRIPAAALISVLEGPGAGDGPNARRVYRHFEVHADGVVEHHLFNGTRNNLGREVPLDAHPETEALLSVLEELPGGGARWDHGAPMLMGRVVNKRGRRIDLGRSDFDSIEDYLLELNEALAIGGENMRLTAKKRAVVDESVLTGPGEPVPDSYDRGDGVRVPYTDTGDLKGTPTRLRFRGGEDLLVSTKLDTDLGGDGTGLFKVLEYSYDAEALIAHKRDLVESAVTRVGLTPQWLGVTGSTTEGFAVSGTALRLRLIPTDKVGRGKARPWDETTPEVLRRGALLEALPIAEGGLGIGWEAPELAPSVERANPIPTDEVEESTVTATLVSARVMSRRQAIKRQHPDWTVEQIDAELEQIDKDTPPASAGLGIGF